MSRKMMSMLSTLFFAYRLFLITVSLDILCMTHVFFPERQSNQCQGLCLTFSEICTKFDAVPIAISHQQLQIKGHKKSAHPPSCMNICTLTPKIC
jgi:hypothetical protein